MFPMRVASCRRSTRHPTRDPLSGVVIFGDCPSALEPLLDRSRARLLARLACCRGSAPTFGGCCPFPLSSAAMVRRASIERLIVGHQYEGEETSGQPGAA